jgi:hypothetical protein
MTLQVNQAVQRLKNRGKEEQMFDLQCTGIVSRARSRRKQSSKLGVALFEAGYLGVKTK